jgi:deazaflavin-dependent oxidoreductase (nitroreductase family)
MKAPNRKTALLEHRGRKSGKVFLTQVWFVDIDGTRWIGSLDGARNWVRNLKATPQARLDIGEGPRDVRAVPVEEAVEVAAFQAAIRSKYPLASRVLRLLTTPRDPVAFRLEAVS